MLPAHPKSWVATGTVTAVASSASNGTLLAANPYRQGATIYNSSTAILYIKCGATASTSSFTIVLPAGATPIDTAFWQVPYGYTGRIDGIWASANGNALVTEFT